MIRSGCEVKGGRGDPGGADKIILDHNVLGSVDESLAPRRVAQAKTAADLLRPTQRGIGWSFASFVV
jgi:hypothetical protein